ncbi:MAG: hypothetical protein II900_05250 [Prevotella sp.]|jgi:hypothetical protein|nr:hypothetical protein [Prevotella sp.]
MKKIIMSIMLLTLALVSISAKDVFTVKSGDPSIILEKGTTALYEIDYSKAVVTNSKDHEDDVPFNDWVVSYEEDDEDAKWKKDENELKKTFREKFNDANKKGVQLTKTGKNYKIILRLTMVDWGAAVKMRLTGLGGGNALISGEFEVQDMNGTSLAVVEFKDQKGGSSFKRIGRLKEAFEWLSNDIVDYIKDYQKAQKKAAKKKK